MDIYNNDCFEVFPKIKEKSINLFLLDLPYANKKFGNCTACAWDTPIDLEKMWIEIKRMMTPNGIIVFFCNTKFGYALINSNPKWFRYDLIWEKSKKVGFLSANKMPLRKHENIYVFDNKEDDIELVRNIELREYSKKCFDFIGKTKKELINEIGQGIDHFFRYNTSQFGLPIKENYDRLPIKNMQGYLTYDELKAMEETSIYNPQKIDGKPYKTKGKGECDIYKTKRIDNENKGDRHPTSILPEFKEIHENIYIFKKEQGTYNPQKTEGKPYKDDVRKKPKNCGAYGNEMIAKPVLNKGDRHPTSILSEFKEIHENIYIFNGEEYDSEKQEVQFNKNEKLVEYSKKIFKFINCTKKEIKKNIGSGIDHFFRYSRGNFSLPIKENYEKLTKFYNLENMEGYLNYEDMKALEIKPPPKIQSTYNPQMTEGKPYKTKETSLTNSYYRDGIEYKSTAKDNKGERHPTSILANFDETHENLYIFKKEQGTYNPQKTPLDKPYTDKRSRKINNVYGEITQEHSTLHTTAHPTTILKYNNPNKSIHRTQKPVDLLEWLIKTYTKEEDLVMDFCMGSGSCGEACKNTNRKFIGIEKDEDIFKIAKTRLENLNQTTIETTI